MNLILQTNKVWTTKSISNELFGSCNAAEIKKTENWIKKQEINYKLCNEENLVNEDGHKPNHLLVKEIIRLKSKKRKSLLYLTLQKTNSQKGVLFANDDQNQRYWIFLKSKRPTQVDLENSLEILTNMLEKSLIIIPSGLIVDECREICRSRKCNDITFKKKKEIRIALEIYSHSLKDINSYINLNKKNRTSEKMTHLDLLESESIHIIREVIAEVRKPVMLYSIGKDSSVMLHLARKAFYPSPPPFPLLHIDTQWKFKAMYDFRKYITKKSGMEMIIHINQEGIDKNINPFDHGSAVHTDIMKTQGLKQALQLHRFDVAFGGARRDEEKSRSKERVFSFRTNSQRWDPKDQRPEIWHLYNSYTNPGENIRVFPISNWTELDIWQYIYRERIPIVPLYFALERPIVKRDGIMIMVDDGRFKLKEKEKIEIKKVRFRTLGCYPLTGAISSNADDLSSVILEILNAKSSEREGRVIDLDRSTSMERKKEEGYF